MILSEIEDNTCVQLAYSLHIVKTKKNWNGID